MTAATSWRNDLARAVEESIRVQALAHERRLAWVRCTALGLATVLDTWFFLDPRGTIGASAFPVQPALVAGVWWLAATLLLVALRRGWYRPWVSVVVPLAEGAMLLCLFLVTSVPPEGLPPPDPQKVLTVTAVACALLAATGALRLQATSVIATTAAGMLVFAVAADRTGYRVAETAFVLAMIASTGLLGHWMALVVRAGVDGEARAVILGRLLPRALAGKSPAEALALVSQPRRVEVTALVSDMRGFTRYAEQRPPEEVMAFLDGLQGALAAAVRAHGGTVDKFLGDGMLAVFGLDGERDHAARALEAAAAMLEAARSLEIAIGIGVHAGPVVAGCLGGADRLELTVIGDTVNTAARLEGVAKERQVVLVATAATVARAGGEASRWGLVAGGAVQLRGREGALEIHVRH